MYGGDGGRTEKALEPATVDQAHHKGGCFDVRGAIEQHVQNNVGVKHHLHRCLLSRWRA